MGGDKILRRIDHTLRDDTGTGKAIGERRMHIFLAGVDRLRPTAGALELLERFGSLRIRRVVATSAKRGEPQSILRATGLEKEIDAATTSDDADRSKPDADIVIAALHVAKATAGRAVFLGDTPYDVESAQKAGVVAVAVECGGWAASELSGARAVYADPRALLREFDRSPFARTIVG